jgi:hypothetical protein
MKHYKDSQNNIYAYELDGSQDHIIPKNYVRISDAEVEAIHQANALSKFNSLSYSEKRAMEYPSLSDQLDMIYHNGIDAWKSEIKKVKDKYPKS